MRGVKRRREKPAFRNAMRHRRVLVPASGFYEWKRPADPTAKKQAYWIRPANGGVVTFGGLMETWHSADGSEIDFGRDPDDRLQRLHWRDP